MGEPINSFDLRDFVRCFANDENFIKNTLIALASIGHARGYDIMWCVWMILKNHRVCGQLFMSELGYTYLRCFMT